MSVVPYLVPPKSWEWLSPGNFNFLLLMLPLFRLTVSLLWKCTKHSDLSSTL